MPNHGNPSEERASEPSAPTDHAARDIALTIRNALKLGSSLVASWLVALVVRFFLPRFLGPEVFGAFNFAEALPGHAVCVPRTRAGDVHPEGGPGSVQNIATDFYAGATAARAVLTGLMLVVVGVVSGLGGHSREVQRTAILFLRRTAPHRHQHDHVRRHLARSPVRRAARDRGDVVVKVLWAVGVAVAIALHAGIEGFALAFLVAEVTRSLGALANPP